MKRHLPLVLTGLGILLLISGFGYDLMFAGIPYHDPTPEMSAHYAFHSRIASALYCVGGGVVVAGVVGGFVRGLGTLVSARRSVLREKMDWHRETGEVG